MTIKSVEEQITAIQVATVKANTSKESAVAFLRNAGIISADFLIKSTPWPMPYGTLPRTGAIGIAVETPE